MHLVGILFPHIKNGNVWPVHQKYERQLVGAKVTLLWPLWEDMKGETESDSIAAQDVALQTEYRETKILQTETGSKYKQTLYSSDRASLICK